MHELNDELTENTEGIFQRIRRINGIEGVTFSGGEPFQQPEALLDLTQRLSSETSLGILIFTGCTPEKVTPSIPLIRRMR